MNKKQIEELKRKTNKYWWYSELSKEVLALISHTESLEAKLEIMRETLKKICNCENIFYDKDVYMIREAAEALAKLNRRDGL